MAQFSIPEAKSIALQATTGRLTLEETNLKLKDYRRYLHDANDAESVKFWSEEVSELESWLSSESLRNGLNPQGIDDLVLNLVGWRASVYAFQNVELQRDPFGRSPFFLQWLVGAGYSTACIVGKLVSDHRNDNSLANLWKKISELVVKEDHCSADEVDLISIKLKKPGGYFTNENSKSMLFRNKTIAHNERTTPVGWDDLDNDIKLLVRIWSIVIGFCSSGILYPFLNREIAFAGLDGVVGESERIQLLKHRQDFLDRVDLWTRSNLVTGQIEVKSRAFAEIVFSFTQTSAESTSEH
jgi:hypothetical protein